MLDLWIITTEVDSLDMFIYIGQDLSQGTAFDVDHSASVVPALVDDPSNY